MVDNNVTSVSSASSIISSNSSANNQKTNQEFDKDTFLKLFIEQLRYQDPLSPQDSSAFMNQMAQFSVMEQLQNLNTSIGQLINMQNVTEAASLVGRTVTVTGSDGTETSGTVEKVLIQQNGSKIVIDGQSYDMTQITQVTR